MRLQPIIDIAELCSRKGITTAILCPGSRCAPLVLGFVNHVAITTRTISDERSAAFIAFGIAQQTQQPVALICTSGTAAYNFGPAVAEAFYQHIPLIVFTADRPEEWTGQWDGQTIQQQHLYGGHVKQFYQLPQDYEHRDSRWSLNRQLNEGINLALSGRKGPVHFNIPLREPLYPAAGEGISFSANIRVIHELTPSTGLNNKAMQTLALKLDSALKVLIVGGQEDHSIHLIEALHELSQSQHIAVIGEIISNLHPLPAVIRHSDVLLGNCAASTKEMLRADLLITFGKSVLTRNLKQFLRDHPAKEHWHLTSEAGPIFDPYQSSTASIQANPEEFFIALNKGAHRSTDRKPYYELWQTEEQKAKAMMQAFFNEEKKGEFGFVNDLLAQLPDHVTLHLANSMAVRYANLVTLNESKKGVRVFGNRGTSGIDGCTSTAVGHVMSDNGMHVLLTGDMAFFYDRNAFWHNYAMQDLRIIVINNGGGAIFGMIDGPADRPEADEYFITQQTLTASSLAAEFGFDYLTIDSRENVAELLQSFFVRDGRTKILEFKSNTKEAQRVFADFKTQMKRP
jgi:2-succinyl-5-enolpyruvyl-6-hydroxy-3-cyclohexene-1-carboxylate synthase